KKLLSIIPGAELVEIDVPRVGTQANSLAQLPEFKRELVRRELQAVADAGVTTLATIYHACHREICDAGDGRSFEVVNFMELLGEGMGLDSEDLYKRLKQIRDIDDIIVETAPLIAANRLDLDPGREAFALECGAKAGAAAGPGRDIAAARGRRGGAPETPRRAWCLTRLQAAAATFSSRRSQAVSRMLGRASMRS